MKTPNSTSEIIDKVTKPTKLEHTTESPTYQHLQEKTFQLHTHCKNKIRSGLEMQNIGCKGYGITSKTSGKDIGSY